MGTFPGPGDLARLAKVHGPQDLAILAKGQAPHDLASLARVLERDKLTATGRGLIHNSLPAIERALWPDNLMRVGMVPGRGDIALFGERSVIVDLHFLHRDLVSGEMAQRVIDFRWNNL